MRRGVGRGPREEGLRLTLDGRFEGREGRVLSERGMRERRVGVGSEKIAHLVRQLSLMNFSPSLARFDASDPGQRT